MDIGMTIDSQFTQGAASAEGFLPRCLRAFSALGRFIVVRFPGEPRSGAANALRVEEKLSLGPKKMLYLVSCREREFLVAAGADTIVSVLEVFSKKRAEAAGQKKASVSRMQKSERLQ